VRRRILRIDVTGGGLGGTSGAAPVIRHGRSGEMQTAFYTGAQPVGGHHRELLPSPQRNVSFPSFCVVFFPLWHQSREKLTL